MERVCAWCGNDMGDDLDCGGPVTHGICEACAEKAMADLAEPLLDFLDRLPAPIIVIDEETILVGANKAALAALNLSQDQVAGKRGGEVMECIHSDEEGGCGGTVHCKACAIRNAVTKTHQTGDSVCEMPAYLNKSGPEGAAKHWLKISTQKLGKAVLLRIDEGPAPGDNLRQ